jgi:hypothetical protein
MPFRVRYSKEYDRVRAQLSPGERLLLGVIEDEIAENPDPRLKGRFEVEGYIYETSLRTFSLSTGFSTTGPSRSTD